MPCHEHSNQIDFYIFHFCFFSLLQSKHTAIVRDNNIRSLFRIKIFNHLSSFVNPWIHVNSINECPSPNRRRFVFFVSFSLFHRVEYNVIFSSHKPIFIPNLLLLRSKYSENVYSLKKNLKHCTSEHNEQNRKKMTKKQQDSSIVKYCSGFE